MQPLQQPKAENHPSHLRAAVAMVHPMVAVLDIAISARNLYPIGQIINMFTVK